MDKENQNLTDEQLAFLIQKGDKEKFGMLIDRYSQKLTRYCKKFFYDQHNIEDMVQEVFLRAYQNILSFHTDQKFSSWIYRIAHNSFVNALKKKSRNPLYFFDFDSFIAHPVHEDETKNEIDRKSIRKTLDKGLKKLKPSYREILILYYIEDLEYKEIGDILHIPMGTVGIRLSRAKAQLKKKLPTNVRLHYE